MQGLPRVCVTLSGNGVSAVLPDLVVSHARKLGRAVPSPYTRSMEISTRIAWAALALVHLPPAAFLFAPRLTEALYGVSPEGTTGMLIVHRGACF